MNEKEIRNQAKIFILYILSNIGEPQEFTTVNDMVLHDGLVNYFDFSFAFSELIETGQIDTVCRPSDGEPLYFVTDRGREVLEMYEQEMSPDVKDKAYRHAMRVLASKRDGVVQKSSIEETDNGWSLCCRIVDKEKTLMETTVFLKDRAYAEQLRDNFDNNAEIIYQGLLSLLSGDVNYIFD